MGTWRTWLACSIGFAVVWFSFLGYRDLLHPDEGRYAEIPREMLATSDWITPHLDGLKYFEKPPLQYWATALAFELFGASNATARLWPAALAFAAVFWTFFVGRRVFGRETGVLGAIVLASSLLWVGMGHILTLDMGLAVLLWFSIGACLLAQTERDDPVRRRRWMLLAWTALAAATLSKGPVAPVLAAGTIAIASVWQRDLDLWRRLHLGLGLCVFLALAAPWFVVVGIRNPGFTEFFFLHEHLARYATNEAGRNGAWWTFFAVVTIGCAPWIGSAVAVLVRPGFAWRGGKGGFDPVRFLWIWCAFTVVFFTLSRSKLVPYALPVFPPLALLVGRRLAARRGLAWDAGSAVALGALLLAIATLPIRVSIPDVPREMLDAYRPSVLAGAALLVGAGIACWTLRARPLAAAGALGAVSLVGFQVLLLGFQCFSSVKSSRELAAAIRGDASNGAPVYCVTRYEQALPFYLGRTVDLVHSRGELDFGLRDDPRREIVDFATFRRVWTALDRGVAIFPPEVYRAMATDDLPMREIHEDLHRVAVARR